MGISPRIFVVAREVRAKHIADLRTWRVDTVVQPELEGGVGMVRRPLTLLNRSCDEIDYLTGELRHTFV